MNFTQDMPSGYYWLRSRSICLGEECVNTPYIIYVTQLIPYRKTKRREIIWGIHGRESLDKVIESQNRPDNLTHYELIKVENPFDNQQ